MAPIRVKTAGDIARSPQFMFEYVTDVETWPRWIATVNKVKDISTRPLAVDATFITQGRYIAQPYTAQNTVLAFEPNRRFIYESRGGFPGKTTLLFTENANGGTHMTMMTDFDLSGPALLLTPTVMVMGRLQYDSYFRKLKAILEGA